MASTVGVTGQEDSGLVPCPGHIPNPIRGGHYRDGVFQACAIAGGVAWAGGAERPHLAEGEIATENRNTSVGECVCQRAEERRLGVTSCTVGED